MSQSVFYLKVQRIEQYCLFELSWGEGLQIGVTIPYPETLDTLYLDWQSTYLSFYKTEELRGRVAATGRIAPPPIDWHGKLVQTEAKLLYEFHQWLRHSQLFEIYSRIARAAREGLREKENTSPPVEVFLTCNPIDLERLPWEAWEIDTELAATGKVRIVRKPLTIRESTVKPQNRRRARILAILGDNTGLDFKADRDAVRSLDKIAEIEFVGWQPDKDIPALKEEIVKAIADEQGWDVLFFAGHSNEKELMGGELGIAPNAALFLNEIARPLTIAKERGLQFALFNSCKGLDLANALIDLGLSQVAVMREPIHNSVAHEFIVQFLQSLAEYKDVHESLLAACRYLKLEKQFTYPSAYLIPSLFRHPNAPLFRLKPREHWLKRWLPTKREAIALGVLTVLSLLPSVQDYLMEQRIWMQAAYRNTTNQIPAAATPPVLLVQIDRESLNKANIDARKINPIDRAYLSRLTDKLSALDAKVVGLDYLLDSPTPEDRVLAKSIRAAIDRNDTWFVFGAVKAGNGELGVIDKVASLDQNLQGHVHAPLWYVPLPPASVDCTEQCPFSYLLALAHSVKRTGEWGQGEQPSTLNLQPSTFNLQPSPPHPLRTRLMESLDRGKLPSRQIAFLHRLRLFPITTISRKFKQLWFYPVIDFSIPPHRAYQAIAAWQLLENADNALTSASVQQQVVLIGAGGYDQAGKNRQHSDNFPIPKAVDYWRSLETSHQNLSDFTGAEAHAYAIHHLLTRRLVVPIPDLWMVMTAALLGKGIQLVLIERRCWSRRWILVALGGATVGLALVGLQVYISAAILVPWLFPSVTVWVYVLPTIWRKSHA